MSSYQAYPLAAMLLFCSLVSAGTVAQESEELTQKLNTRQLVSLATAQGKPTRPWLEI